MNIYIITYEVDTGWAYTRDTALVKAKNIPEAQKILEEYISRLGNEYMVTKIFDIELFDHNVFTREFNYGTVNK